VINIYTIIQARRFEYLFPAGKSLALLINKGERWKPEKFLDFFLEAVRREAMGDRKAFLFVRKLALMVSVPASREGFRRKFSGLRCALLFNF
jgi:hypothetical protein